MRAFFASTLLVAVLFAAGCGGGSGGGSTTGGGTPSGEAAKSATQVLADGVKAANAASSVHMSGQLSQAGKQIGIDLSIAKGKGATGSLTIGGAKVDIVLVGGFGYLRGGSTFWKQFGGANGSAIAQLLTNKWLKFPENNAQFGSLTSVANASALFHSLQSSHGKIANQGATTYKGQSVIALVDTTRGGTLYIAASGTPYPVAIVKTKSGNAGAITFDRWGQSVTLAAPKGAIDFSHLGSG